MTPQKRVLVATVVCFALQVDLASFSSDNNFPEKQNIQFVAQCLHRNRGNSTKVVLIALSLNGPRFLHRNGRSPRSSVFGALQKIKVRLPKTFHSAVSSEPSWQ